MGWFEHSLGAVVLGSLVGSASCGDTMSFRADLEDRLRARVCESDCGCSGRSCESWASVEALRIHNLLDDFELTFDDECFSDRLEGHAANECRPLLLADSRYCGVPCTLAYGTRAVGEECTDGESFSTCQRGLVCRSSVCADPCDRSAVGTACSNGVCPYPTSCDADTDTCQALPGEDEVCLNGRECQEGLFCTGGTCRGPGEFGASCTGHDQCRSGNCPAGFCVPLPVEGESCAGQVSCSVGLQCQSDICVAETRPGDPCPCAEDQWCENDRCRLASVDQCGAEFLVE